jgi:hypothetical protein
MLSDDIGFNKLKLLCSHSNSTLSACNSRCGPAGQWLRHLCLHRLKGAKHAESLAETRLSENRVLQYMALLNPRVNRQFPEFLAKIVILAGDHTASYNNHTTSCNHMQPIFSIFQAQMKSASIVPHSGQLWSLGFQAPGAQRPHGKCLGEGHWGHGNSNS